MISGLGALCLRFLIVLQGNGHSDSSSHLLENIHSPLHRISLIRLPASGVANINLGSSFNRFSEDIGSDKPKLRLKLPYPRAAHNLRDFVYGHVVNNDRVGKYIGSSWANTSWDNRVSFKIKVPIDSLVGTRKFHLDLQGNILRWRQANVLYQNANTYTIKGSGANFDLLYRKVASDLSFPISFGKFGKPGCGFRVALGYCKGIISIGSSVASNLNSFSRVIERSEQAQDTSKSDPETASSPPRGFFGLIRSLPFGAKLGFTILSAGIAWPVMFGGWDRLDGFGRCIRDRSKGLGYCGLAVGLLAISAVPWW